MMGLDIHHSRTLSRAFNMLMPVYLQNAAIDNSAGHEKTASRVSFLDGLRGYASLIVFISHFLEPFEPAKRFGYGFGEEHNSFLQLPIIRVFYSGVPMVAIFFIISGYALSYKPFMLVHHGPASQLSDTLASAIFRRDSLEYATLPGVIEPRPRRFVNARDQFTDWCRFVVDELTNPWDWRVADYVYDSHLWTIPIEFRASLVLFLVLTCISRIRRLYRLAISAALGLYCMWCGKWHMALFMCGMLFADLAAMNRAPLVTSNRYWCLVISLVPLILGLLLLSFPIRNGHKTPGYVLLSRITLNYNIWHTFGAILVFWAFENSLILRRAFDNSFARYLGKISYALYIVHGPILHSLGYGITSYICGLGENLSFSNYSGLFLGFLLVAPIVFWWADIFERLVDQQSVKLARWMYMKVRIE
ncbi:hypothetical protein VHEMI07078 [[Torrubiella] hemipterigena]|uniref:Acyltransferase 3 domain-containing protein n=1 Tax=[Torrubiella] hemipterigena TaxID=1531966 RepID=A0A0A1T989_9HYPO|nr:hypothetical protein VHEMI07078 [[Torrubiella] hemipterigena]